MRKIRKSPLPPARWERWLAALTSLTLLLIPPVAIVIGLMEFAIFRKRYWVFAYQGLQVAIWQVFISLIVLTLYFSSSLFQAAGALIKTYNMDDIHQLSGIWTSAPLSERLVLVLLFVFVFWYLAVMFWSMVSVLRGRSFEAPIIGRALSAE